MYRLLLLGALGVTLSAGWAKADGIPWPTPLPRAEPHGWGPHASSVTWPSVYPPGWYTNTYRHAWYYPWYANYNYSHGPYANWMIGGGYAGYAYHGPAGYYYYPNVQPAEPYIGEWYGRRDGGGSFDNLKGLAYPRAYPLPYPRELK